MTIIWLLFFQDQYVVVNVGDFLEVNEKTQAITMAREYIVF